MSTFTDWLLGTKPEQLKLASDAGTIKHIVPKVPMLDHSSQSLTSYATKSELVYACIEKKAQAATDPVLILQKKKGDDWEQIDEHPALDLLNEPNPWDDGDSFLRTWIASENIAGEFYAEIVRSRAGVPAELYPLRPDYLYPQYVSRGGSEVLDHYLYYINGKPIKFLPDDLLIKRRHGLGSMYSGVSPLYVALNPVDADIAATEYIRAFYNNGATPSGILKVKGRKMSEEDMAAAQQKFVNRYGRGGKMRGGPMILDEDGDYEAIGSNLSELNSGELTQIDETRICMAFGVPPVLIGAYVGLQNVNQKASFKGAMEEFWMNTMSPELKQLRQFLTRKFLPLYGEAEAVMRGDIRFFWDMTNVSALQEDVDAVHDRIALGYKTGIYKLDEAREHVGLEPVGGEEGEAFFSAPAVEEPEKDILDEETLVEKRMREKIDAELLGRVFMNGSGADGQKLGGIINGNGQKKTFNYEGLELHREPNEIEKSIDLKAIADSYDSGKEALTRIVLDIRKDLIDQAVKAIPKVSDSDVFTLTLVPPKNAYKQVGKVLEKSVEEGRRQIEHEALKSSIRKAKHSDGPVGFRPGVSKSAIDDLIKRLVELTVSRIINGVQTAAIDIFAALGVLGLDTDEIEQRMREELDERSEKPFEGYARQAINEAVNAGRREEMEARDGEIERYQYSAILDNLTCSPCEEWDGATADRLDQLPETPNPECEGMSNCRCFIIAIFGAEVS